MRKLANTILMVFFFLFLMLLNLTPVFAEDNISTKINGLPAYPRDDNPRTESIFIHELDIGEEATDGILITNYTNETKTVIVYPADKIISSDGGFGCRQYAEAREEVGSWVTMDVEELTLDPNSSAIVDFKISVPDSADVGENNGCIVIQEKNTNELEPGINLSIRKAIRLVVTVPGDLIRDLELVRMDTKIEGDLIIVKPVLKNNGTVSIDAAVELTVKDVFGNELGKISSTYTTYREQESILMFQFKQSDWGGPHYLNLKVTYDKNNFNNGSGDSDFVTLTATDTIWIMPKATVVAVCVSALCVVGSLIYYVFVYSADKRLSKDWIEYGVKPGDTISKLSEKYKVSSRLIALVNKIKPEDKLNVGKKIKVPPSK
ncbi:LysM peptidoglycan-binding domain-containing protein [Candidatus Dojkabacteria bacterium]|nr:LysM peptidoglycan-binding domain-containing protein [Candidatus Dojkabacteria bacterium]